MSAVAQNTTDFRFERSRSEALRALSEIMITRCGDDWGPEASIGVLEDLEASITKVFEQVAFPVVEHLIVEAEYEHGCDVVTADAIQSIRNLVSDEIQSAIQGRINELIERAQEERPNRVVIDLTGARFKEPY